MKRASLPILTIAVLASMLASCSRKPADVALHADLITASKAAAAAPASSQTAAPAAAGPMLAYDYTYDLQAPGDHVRPLLSRHEQACAAAGPATCQVLNDSVSTVRDDVSGTLKLRATEAWLRLFRNGLDGDVKAVGGRVLGSQVQTEDLTRSIVDTGAALRAKTLLRDRLEKLLAERPGKLSDLVELETNIATVQGDIDTGQSELAVMQQRVSMSTLTLTYNSSARLLSHRGADPLAAALDSFVDNVVTVVALLITLASYLLPVLATGLVGWLVWRRFGRRKTPRRAAASPGDGKA